MFLYSSMKQAAIQKMSTNNKIKTTLILDATNDVLGAANTKKIKHKRDFHGDTSSSE